MKKSLRARLRLLIIAVSLLAGGWVGANALPQSSQEQLNQMMEMMKQKMMNRPAEMKKVDNTIRQYIKKAAADGNYACCLKHPCKQCAVNMGECPCGMNAMDDKPVCHECKGGWHAGDGAIPGKTADQIKVMPRM